MEEIHRERCQKRITDFKERLTIKEDTSSRMLKHLAWENRKTEASLRFGKGVI